jgi:peptidyl-prolyl cis-trans isomerase C
MTSEDQRKIVLDELVGQTLLSQAARDNGFVLAESDLQSRITALANKMGGADALAQWQTAHGYTPAQFESSLARSIAADWMSARIQAEVPTTAEQVHARQILVFDEDSAQAAISRLKAGTEFATLAYRYETVTGGDLGWFPKGYLTAPEVEEAAFALQAGEVSGIIKSSIGYHIVQVIERDSQRALSPDALQARQIQVIKDWIASKMAESQVVILP